MKSPIPDPLRHYKYEPPLISTSYKTSAYLTVPLLVEVHGLLPCEIWVVPVDRVNCTLDTLFAFLFPNIPAKVAIGRCLLEDGTRQFQSLNDRVRSKIKVLHSVKGTNEHMIQHLPRTCYHVPSVLVRGYARWGSCQFRTYQQTQRVARTHR